VLELTFCCAGLTLGLMGLDLVNLQGELLQFPSRLVFEVLRYSCTCLDSVLSTSGTEQEQRDAKKVIKLLERGRHWVLVVLLLSNVVVNESLRMFMFALAPASVN